MRNVLADILRRLGIATLLAADATDGNTSAYLRDTTIRGGIRFPDTARRPWVFDNTVTDPAGA